MATPYTGNPAAIQAPGPVPNPGSQPIYSLPQTSDGADWANVSQPFKESADYIAWIMKFLIVRFHDEFIDAQSTMANRYSQTDANSGTHTVADDAAGFGFGALKHDGTAGGTASTGTVSTFAMGLSTGDFFWRTRVRFTSTTGNTTCQIGITDGTTNQRLFFQLNAGSLNWTLKVDSATPSPLATIAAGSAYQFLDISRINGVLNMFVGGTLIYTGADVVDRSNSKVSITSTAVIMWDDYWELRS